MSDETIRDIEALKRERLEDRHSMQDAFKELTGNVSILVEKVRDLAERDVSLRSELSKRPTANGVRDLIAECANDSESPLCKMLYGRVNDITGQISGQVTDQLSAHLAAVEGPSDPHAHEGAAEFWACADCSNALVDALKSSDSLADKRHAVFCANCEEAASALREQGYTVEQSLEKPESLFLPQAQDT